MKLLHLMLYGIGAVALICWMCGCGGGNGAGGSRSSGAIEITTESGVAMMLIPPGSFMMGSEDGAEDEVPLHEVMITAFAMDKYEVTQDQYASLEIPDPSHFKDPRRPVEQVRWSDAALFCNERSRIEGFELCYDEFNFECNYNASGYRLPTEAEWEYAARAGASTDYDFGNDPAKLNSYACYAENSLKKTDLVGRKKANRWGLHDMYGNVMEWCNDLYGADYYQESPVEDPVGPWEGAKVVVRGGAWNSSAEACRASARRAELAGVTDACFTGDTLGFRCVRRLTPEELELLK